MAVSRVKSIATRRFWELFRALPSEIQNLAVKNYHLWRQNPHHPSLRFRRVQGSEDRYSIRAEITIAPSPGEWARRSFGFGSAPTQITTGWQAPDREESTSVHAADRDADQRQGEADHDHTRGPTDQVEHPRIDPFTHDVHLVDQQHHEDEDEGQQDAVEQQGGHH